MTTTKRGAAPVRSAPGQGSGQHEGGQDVSPDAAAGFRVRIGKGVRGPGLGVRFDHRAGFSMLEMIVVLSIMVLIIGIGVASFQFFEDDNEFDEPAARLSQMSKFALQAAMVRHRGVSIGFDESGFGVLGENAGPGSRYELPGKMALRLWRWGSRDWEKAEGQIWHFGEQGICEPLKVRFESKTGSHEISFHPLTGGPIVQP